MVSFPFSMIRWKYPNPAHGGQHRQLRFPGGHAAPLLEGCGSSANSYVAGGMSASCLAARDADMGFLTGLVAVQPWVDLHVHEQ